MNSLSKGSRGRDTVAGMLHRSRPRADPALLELFEASGRNVQRATALLRDLLAAFPEEAADQLGLYGVEAPMEQSQQMAEVLVSAADAVAEALHEWRAGGDMSRSLVEVHRLENDADRLVRQAVASLFATGIDPMLVIRWKDIFETLEEAVDACERVANVLEGIVLKQANGHR